LNNVLINQKILLFLLCEYHGINFEVFSFLAKMHLFIDLMYHYNKNLRMNRLFGAAKKEELAPPKK
jgi:hypothetical protein